MIFGGICRSFSLSNKSVAFTVTMGILERIAEIESEVCYSSFYDCYKVEC